MSPSPPALQLRGIAKSFRPRRTLRQALHLSRPETIRVLRGVDLEVERGSVIGIMGPNASGKSTLLRIVAGILQPESGTVRIMGRDPSTHRAQTSRLTGYLSSSERSFYWRLSVMDNLRFFGRLHDLRGIDLGDRIDEVAESLEVRTVLHRRFADLSTGFRQRLSLARALLHDPELLVLDEPTRSLDAESSDGFRRTLSALAVRGRTVIMATHSLREAAQLCDRTFNIVQERLVEIDTQTELETTEVRVELSVSPTARPPEGAVITGNELTCPLAMLAEVLGWVHARGITVSGLHIPEDVQS